MAGELKHKETAGVTTLAKTDWEGVDSHVLDSQAEGDLIYASSATQLSRLAPGTAGQSLLSGGPDAPPAWGVGMTAGNAQGDVLYYNGSAWAVLGYSTSGYILKTNGVSANPSWTAPYTDTLAVAAAKTVKVHELAAPTATIGFNSQELNGLGYLKLPVGANLYK